MNPAGVTKIGRKRHRFLPIFFFIHYIITAYGPDGGPARNIVSSVGNFVNSTGNFADSTGKVLHSGENNVDFVRNVVKITLNLCKYKQEGVGAV